MLWRQRRVGFIALCHGKAGFHIAPKARGFGVHIADAHGHRVFADIVKQGGAFFFKEKRQVIFHPRAEMPFAHRFIHGGIGGVGFDFFAKARAEDFLRICIGGKFVRRQQADFAHRRERALAVGVESFDAVDFIVKHIEPIRRFAAHRENIQNAAAHRKFARGHHIGDAAVARFHQAFAQSLDIERLPRFEPKRARRHKRQGRELLHRGRHGHKQHIGLAAFQLPQGREPLRHQILMRRKALVRQRFPVGQKHGMLLRAEKLPRRLQAQSLLHILGEHHFKRAGRQIFGEKKRQAAARKAGPNGFLGRGGENGFHKGHAQVCRLKRFQTA